MPTPSRDSEMHALAQRFREEIAHKHDQRLVARLAQPIDRVIRTFFIQKTHVTGMEYIRRIPEHTPVILSSVHKSHLDYVILGVALYFSADQLIPATIAGKNLFHGLFHRLLPRLKGVCLDRERVNPKNLRSRENLLYLSTFYDYLMDDVVHAGDMISIFPEGGRSYTGEILPLSLGIFGIAKRALTLEKSDSVAIVPIGISYDRVTEDMRFTGLMKYKKKSGKLYRAYDKRAFLHHALFQPKGRAYVDIGPPMYVTDFRHMDALEKELRARMERLIRVTPAALVCRALVGKETLPLRTLMRQVHDDVAYARTHACLMSRGIRYRGAGHICKSAFIHLANRLRMRDILRIDRAGKCVTVLRPDVVAYYANTIAHLFPPHSSSPFTLPHDDIRHTDTVSPEEAE